MFSPSWSPGVPWAIKFFSAGTAALRLQCIPQMEWRPRKNFLLSVAVGVLVLYGIARLAVPIWWIAEVYRRSDPVKIVVELHQKLARSGDPVAVRAWATPKLEANSGQEVWTDFPKGIQGLGVFKETDGATNFIMIPFGSHRNVTGLA